MPSELLEGQRIAGVGAVDGGRHADRGLTRASIAAVASLSDLPSARLNEIVVAGWVSWWLTEVGVELSAQLAKADSGTIDSVGAGDRDAGRGGAAPAARRGR